MRYVFNGAKLIGTNPDLTGPSELGIRPACRAYVAPIELNGQESIISENPDPLMMRTGLRMLGVATEDAVIVGDRMDTDIVAGIESEIDTALVLSGVTNLHVMRKFPYRPKFVFKGVGDILTDTPEEI